jgi:ribonuclease HII
MQSDPQQGSLVMGIDEAGRGPALGPLVMAAVALEPSAAGRLTRAGVTDSKRFGAGDKAHKARKELLGMIESVASFIGYAVCDVQMVDDYVRRGELNELERHWARDLIARAPTCKRIVADGARMFGPLKAQFPHLEAHDQGESMHTAVAAASICAKVRRDDLFALISDRYTVDFGALRGGGYVNKGTHAFTKAYETRHGHLPPEARGSWPWDGNPKLFRV